MKKYFSKPIIYEGIYFDSIKERNRYIELRGMEKRKEIFRLQRQVHFELIPDQRKKSEEVFTKGARKGQKKPGKMLERKCEYVADFMYFTAEGDCVVEDVKGFREGTAYAVFVIKRKLMLWRYGIQVREV